jgi:hypothetical protein
VIRHSFFEAKKQENFPFLSSRSQLYNGVEATSWLKMSTGVGKALDAMTVNRESER